MRRIHPDTSDRDTSDRDTNPLISVRLNQTRSNATRPLDRPYGKLETSATT